MEADIWKEMLDRDGIKVWSADNDSGLLDIKREIRIEKSVDEVTAWYWDF